MSFDIKFSELTPAKWKLFRKEASSVWARMRDEQKKNEELKRKLEESLEMQRILEYRLSQFAMKVQEMENGQVLSEILGQNATEN